MEMMENSRSNLNIRTGTFKYTQSSSVQEYDDIAVIQSIRSREPPPIAQRVAESTQLTVGEAIERIGIGWFQYRILLLCGLFNAADAMEMLLLAVLAPVLKCEWLLAEFEIALITTIVFVGAMIMAPFWGSLADIYGRRNILIAVCLWISFYGFLTAFSPTFNWVLLTRGFVGAGIAGAAQAFILTSEYIPKYWRPKFLVAYNVFWTAGSLFEIAISALIIPNVSPESKLSGWRLLVLFSSLPIALVALIVHKLPESVRYLVISGREVEAKEILDEAAFKNKQPVLLGRLKAEINTQRGDFRELFKSGLALITLRSWLLWFTASFAYYGMILLSAVLLEIQKIDCSKDSIFQANLEAGGSAASANAVCSCTPPSKETFNSMLLATFGETLSVVLNLLTLKYMNRKTALALYSALQGLLFLFLTPCGLSPIVVTIFMFLMRGLSSAYFVTLYIYIAEIFPTPIRALSMGSCAAVSRLGAILTPYVAQVLIQHNRIAALILYSIILLSSAIISLTMPDRHSINDHHLL